MSTSEALRKLANQEIRQVCLLHRGQFAVVVTYDETNEELIFRFISAHRHLSVTTLLFHTEPAWVL